MLRRWILWIITGAVLGSAAFPAWAQADIPGNTPAQQTPQQQLQDEMGQILQSQVRGNMVVAIVPDLLFNGGAPSLTAIAQERLAKVAPCVDSPSRSSH